MAKVKTWVWWCHMSHIFLLLFSEICPCYFWLEVTLFYFCCCGLYFFKYLEKLLLFDVTHICLSPNYPVTFFLFRTYFHPRTISFRISGVVSPIINLFVSSFLNPSSTSYFLYFIFGCPSTIVIWTSDKDCWHPPDISCLVLLFASFIHYHWIMTWILHIRHIVESQ